VKYRKRRKKRIKILNTKIPTDTYKMAIFPVGIPYYLQKIPTTGIFPYEWQHCFILPSQLVTGNCRIPPLLGIIETSQ